MCLPVIIIHGKTRIKNQEWSDEVTTLDIHIVPPLWLTWWAKCSYVLLSGAILFFILYAYKKKLDMEVLYDLEKRIMCKSRN